MVGYEAEKGAFVCTVNKAHYRSRTHGIVNNENAFLQVHFHLVVGTVCNSSAHDLTTKIWVTLNPIRGM